MKTYLNRKTLAFQAAFIAGALTGPGSASAAGNNFSDIARNINASIEELPGLISGVSYMLGLLLGVLGVIKLKDHVENPTQTPIKDGAIRLAAGGALFGLPIVMESMLNTIGTTGTVIEAPTLSRAEFNIR
jgi:hypothetical protein